MNFDFLKSVHHSEDCGNTRRYTFRRIKTTAIRFKVKAERDAAIALSPDDEEEPGDMYEVNNYLSLRKI